MAFIGNVEVAASEAGRRRVELANSAGDGPGDHPANNRDSDEDGGDGGQTQPEAPNPGADIAGVERDAQGAMNVPARGDGHSDVEQIGGECLR